MSIVVDDLLGLNAETMLDRPVLVDEDHAVAIAAARPELALSIAGLRHSQGGHTVVPQGRMLQTMTSLNRIGVPHSVAHQRWIAVIDVEAGASWSELHRVLGAYGMAPMVQQSSASFSIGGSISVNCHSRDHRWGPISRTVEDLTILTGTGVVMKASRQVNPDLFHAAIGGYGCCGLILKATLRVIANVFLQYVGGGGVRTVDDYLDHTKTMFADSNLHMNFAWLCCVQGKLYNQALITDFKYQSMPQELIGQWTFKEQAWGEDEILLLGWQAARDDPGKMRQAIWDQLCKRHWSGVDEDGKTVVETRLDWFRASVDFSALRVAGAAEILQEYFVPPDKLPGMIDALRRIFTDSSHPINVLSTTLRYVREDDETVLSYCRGGPRICIAIDAYVETVSSKGGYMLAPRVIEAIELAIQTALDHGGSYYLPYATLADRDAFRRAYPQHPKIQAAIDTYNPIKGGVHRYWNNFLAAYFD